MVTSLSPFFLCSSAKYATYIQYIWNPVLKETCKSCSDTNSITWSHFIRYSSIYHLGKHNWILLYSTVVLSEMLDLWTIASCFIEPLLNNLFFFQAITKLSLRMTWIHGLGYYSISFEFICFELEDLKGKSFNTKVHWKIFFKWQIR